MLFMQLRFGEIERLHLLNIGGVELWCEQSLERGVGSPVPVFACACEEFSFLKLGGGHKETGVPRL